MSDPRCHCNGERLLTYEKPCPQHGPFRDKTDRGLWHRVRDFFLGHGPDCDEEHCGHGRWCWP